MTNMQKASNDYDTIVKQMKDEWFKDFTLA